MASEALYNLIGSDPEDLGKKLCTLYNGVPMDPIFTDGENEEEDSKVSKKSDDKHPNGDYPNNGNDGNDDDENPNINMSIAIEVVCNCSFDHVDSFGSSSHNHHTNCGNFSLLTQPHCYRNPKISPHPLTINPIPYHDGTGNRCDGVIIDV